MNCMTLFKQDRYEYLYEKLENISKSPYYLFDEEKLIRNMDCLRQILGSDIKLCFSLKANPWFADIVKTHADLVELCSHGELKRCKKAGFSPQSMVLDGLLKTDEEIEEAISFGVRRISVDSWRQLMQIQRAAERQGKQTSVVLRLTSGNQFGMEQEEAQEIINKRGQFPKLNIEGIHYYPGTQKKDGKEIKSELNRLGELVNGIESKCGYQLRTIEMGCGIGVPYFVNEDVRSYMDALEAVSEGIHKLSSGHEIVYEAGRLLASTAGAYITKVIDCKYRRGKKFLIVDGGIHHFSYYGQIAGRRTPVAQAVSRETGKAQEEEVTVCGSLCTAQDILARNMRLAGTEAGSYLIFYGVGAYSVTECYSDFLSRLKPSLMLKRRTGEFTLLRGNDNEI